jgi:hypothetical protein
MLLLAAASAFAVTPSPMGGSMTCQGTCDVPCEVNALAVNFDGVKAGFQCNDPPRQVIASLRATDKERVWIGDMQGRQPEDPTRLEVIQGMTNADSVAKLPFGWFAISSFNVSDGELLISMIVDKQLPPTRDDIRILERARELLSDERKWNRQDNRTCPPNPGKWSLFCALLQATQEVTGDVHYRQPALQAAREVLDEVGTGRFGKHRIMDYNNHPETTLAEIQQLLRTARERLQKWLPSGSAFYPDKPGEDAG